MFSPFLGVKTGLVLSSSQVDDCFTVLAFSSQLGTRTTTSMTSVFC